MSGERTSAHKLNEQGLAARQGTRDKAAAIERALFLRRWQEPDSQHRRGQDETKTRPGKGSTEDEVNETQMNTVEERTVKRNTRNDKNKLARHRNEKGY